MTAQQQVMTPKEGASSFSDLLEQQRKFFASGATQSLDFRLEQLERLKQAIIGHQDAIVAAARSDLGRPEFEAYFEIGMLAEIKLALKQLRAWVKPKRVAASLEQFPASAWIQPEPLGVVLIIGPWNYPFQLMISPLVGAIAAGNCAILKPSELAPATSRAVATMMAEWFEPTYIAVVEGGVETSQALLAERFDHIFFTGGIRVGRIVMEAAAQYLTPVTLELGGKSPCIVDREVPLERAAKRIAWGKFINAGQTCIAPDYVLVDRSIKGAFLEHLRGVIQGFYGTDPAQSPDYGRIVGDRHFERLSGLLQSGGGQIVVGGQTDATQRYIAPTVLEGVQWDDPIMEEEIFGPILPVLDYDDLDRAIAHINARPKPLALYLFSTNSQKQERVLQATSSGGVCLNDTVMQVGVWSLPFGGVGDSGIGAYHGKASFDTFSHFKSVLKRQFWLDLNWRYAPYQGKLGFLKRVVTGG